MTKDDVAALLDEIGTLLELKGENAFRTKTYHTAARNIAQMEGNLDEAVRNNTLGQVRGIGDSLVEKITTLVTTGELPYLNDLRASLPPGLFDMLKIPGIGPKKVKALYDELHIDTLDALKVACEAGQVAKLKGFGAKTQEKILTGIAFVHEVGNRVRIDQAYPLGVALLEQLSKLSGVVRSALCGSLRRRRETSKDIDILISSDTPGPIMAAFVALPEVMQVTGHGETKSSIIAQMGIGTGRIVLNADLRIVKDDHFPFALLHFTGSKEHNIRLRARAIELGLSLNEYALANATTSVAAKTEADIYAALGMQFLPPEMREDTGEVELSLSGGPIPKLIEPNDIKGVFHNHTTYSDGVASLREMALAAKALGWEYFGVGDHSQSLRIANGLSPERVRDQWKVIDELNRELKGIRILKGIECDILEDGSLDYDDELLAGFDYVVASVHIPSEDITERTCRALQHPATTMLGHMTGRLLLRRAGYNIDVERVLQTAAEHGKMIEINAQPSRLDLDWIYCKRAKQLGIPLVINPDAHSPEELGLFVFGVNVARRAWLTEHDIFNTKSLKEVLKSLGKVR